MVFMVFMIFMILNFLFMQPNNDWMPLTPGPSLHTRQLLTLCQHNQLQQPAAACNQLPAPHTVFRGDNEISR